MVSNLADCFICGALCDAKCSNQGFYITKNLNMPLIAVLTRVLRTFDTEAESNAYFCCDCVQKIQEYDHLVKLSSQIEADLNAKFKNKPVKSSGLLDDHIFVDQNEIRDFLKFKSNLDLNDNTQINKNEVIDLSIASPSNLNDARAKISPKSIDYVAVEHGTKDSTETIALLNQLNHFDDVQGLEIIAVVDHLNDIGEMQNVETIAVEIQQMEQLLSNEQQNEGDESYEFTSDDDDDFIDDSDRNFDAHIVDVPEEPMQLTKNNEPTVEKCKTKASRKGKRYKKKLIQSESLSCHVCGRSYKSKGALGIHMVKHSDQNPHSNKSILPIKFCIFNVRFNFHFMLVCRV